MQKKGKQKALIVLSKFGDQENKKGSNINDKLLRYANAHSRALVQSDYIKYYVLTQTIDILKPKILKLQASINKCGSWLVLRNYFTINENRLISADFCKKHLLCPLCAIRRGAKYLAAYLPKYEQVIRDNKKIKAYMVTFTVKNGDDLAERVNHLQKSYRAMLKDARNYNYGKKGYKYVEACKAFGGVFSTEVKRGKNSNSWHPHLHMVWLCEEVPDFNKLAVEWKQYTGDSHVVDVSAFFGDPVSSFSEVFKYALKFSDMTPEDTWIAYDVLKGKRLIDNFGLLRGIKVDEDLLDKPLDEDLPYIDLFYSYIHKTSSYSLMKTELSNSAIEQGYLGA